VEALKKINARILGAAIKYGRDPAQIRLVAVSKTFPVEKVKEVFAAGQRIFGENYVQEGVEKSLALKALARDVEFHFIGHLQRNKVREALSAFDLIHTLDRESLALEIQKQSAGRKVPVLIQVNISREQTKSGFLPEDLLGFGKLVSTLPALELRGLMCIASRIEQGEGLVREQYQAMNHLKQELSDALGYKLPELSMGMSDDFEIAIEYGATLVRVGSAIFGERGV